ncbi:hypothetical protein E4U60_005549 [Claviceps pazoutovae]|uniref:Uncharacterized protein n=1 Tax=Claviceps pazoutovae TaxID=1649127 RepID=A0A9P7SET9_9HYPO|nr:hypothetical protein E4U60_005549 [Claviceps pazoutovae]
MSRLHNILSGLSDDVLDPLSSLINTGKKIQHILSLSHLDETPHGDGYILARIGADPNNPITEGRLRLLEQTPTIR